MIYSDLDATFLDGMTYSWEESLPALRAVLKRGVPVVFCSSKTRAEIAALLSELNLSQPFIAENGGGVYVPQGYFSFSLDDLPAEGGFRIIALGTPYASLVRALKELREELGVAITGFSEMSTEEVAQLCGLGLVEASRSKLRQFDEPFVLGSETSAEIVARLHAAVSQRGLQLTRGGRFFHLTGSNDKGAAVRRLNELFERELGPIETAGIGDSANDLPMLAAVDHPVLVRKPGGRFDEAVVAALPNIAKPQGIGPAAWAAYVRQVRLERETRGRKTEASRKAQVQEREMLIPPTAE